MSIKPARKLDTVNIDPFERDDLLRDISLYLELVGTSGIVTGESFISARF